MIAALLLAAAGSGAAASPSAWPVLGEDCARCHAALRDKEPGEGEPAAEPEGAFDVVVVGGGLAGLSAAWELKDLKVLVLEKEGQAGGKIRREAFASGRRHPVAGVFMGEPQGELKRMFRALHLRPQPVREPTDKVFLDGRLIDAWWTPEGIAALPNPDPVREQFGRLARDLADISRRGRLPIPFHGGDKKLIRELDARTFRDYLYKEYGPEPAELGDLFSRDMFGVGGDEVSAAVGLAYLASELEPTVSFDGGLGAVSEALSGALGARLKTGRLVESVEEKGSRVEVVSIDASGHRRSASASAAVLAVPSMVARRIARGLSIAKAAALAKPVYSAYAVVAMDFRERVYDGSYMVWGPGLAFSDLTFTSSLGPAKGGSGGQTASAYLPLGEDEGRARLLGESDDALVSEVKADLDKVFPGASTKIQQTRVIRWGHAMPVPRPGQLTSLAPALARPDGRLYFAGVDTEVPCLEAAIDSGLRAAAEVRARLRRKQPKTTP